MVLFFAYAYWGAIQSFCTEYNVRVLTITVIAAAAQYVLAVTLLVSDWLKQWLWGRKSIRGVVVSWAECTKLIKEENYAKLSYRLSAG